MRLQPVEKVVPLHRRAKHARHAPWRAAVDDLDARVRQLERRLGQLDKRFTGLAVARRIQGALAFSIFVHLVVIFGVTFTLPNKSLLKDATQPLEVVLVNAKSQTRPHKADALAQHNLDGGGNTDAARRAKSPLPVTQSARETADVTLAQQRVQQLEQEARELLARRGTAPPVAAAPPQPERQTEPQIGPNTADLMQRSLEIARLEARIAKDWDAYQQRPRRKFVGARTQEFRFARYIEDWRQKIERVGEMNYPQAARDQKVYGSLVLTVSIKSDGTTEKIEINRSSGHKVLDEAALRIVQLAAPFSAFSGDIAKDTDILSITRTWTFTRADQLVTD
jgi:periplasmic protein TonB